MSVLLCHDTNINHLQTLLSLYGLNIQIVVIDEVIPGSFWQAPEAGLIKNTLYLRNDTPVHSVLHEACHYICMDSVRRENLHTDAGGSTIEESGVCYLQILLANYLPEISPSRICEDMDTWGYSFRLGSTKAWFDNDAEDAFEWLLQNKVISSDSKPTWLVRK